MSDRLSPGLPFTGFFSDQDELTDGMCNRLLGLECTRRRELHPFRNGIANLHGCAGTSNPQHPFFTLTTSASKSLADFPLQRIKMYHGFGLTEC